MLLAATQSVVDGCFTEGRHTFRGRRDGLGLLVVRKPNGTLSRTFQQQVRVNGRLRTLGLGSVTKVSLHEALVRAEANVRRLDAGESPVKGSLAAESVRISTVPVLRDAVERFADVMAEGEAWEARSVRLFRQRMALHVYPALGERPLDSLTRADVLAVLQAERLRAVLPTARKVLQGLRYVFAWAMAFEWMPANLADENMRLAAFAGRVHRTAHHPALSADALAGVLDGIDARETWPSVGAAVRFIALTLVRSVEVRLATWDEIDLCSRTWTVPAARTKMRREHRVPLSECAVEVLRGMAAFLDEWGYDASGLVFPAARGKAMVGTTLSRAVQGTGGTVHGLRSTFRTWAAEAGVRREVAESVLAHVTGSQVEAAYLRTDYLDERRDLMARWSACGLRRGCGWLSRWRVRWWQSERERRVLLPLLLFGVYTAL